MPMSELPKEVAEAAAKLLEEPEDKVPRVTSKPWYFGVLLAVGPALAAGFFSFLSSRVEAEAQRKQQESELKLSVDATYSTLATSVNDLKAIVQANSIQLQKTITNKAKLQGQVEEIEKLLLVKHMIRKPKILTLGDITISGQVRTSPMPVGSGVVSAPIMPASQAGSVHVEKTQKTVVAGTSEDLDFAPALEASGYNKLKTLPANADDAIKAYQATQAK